MVDTLELSAVVASIDANSAGERLGLRVGDRIMSVNGVVPRDVIEWYSLVDETELSIELERDGRVILVSGARQMNEPFGVNVSSALFDRVHTCDNHCEFCFIYQLPKGLRRSLYLKDDDYRLSFLFGNFTTLTRFTEADLERVVDERLSPIYVSIHAVSPSKRAEMLRNERGGCSLRWMRLLIDHGIQVRGQIVLCPGVNDEELLEETLLAILEEFPDLHSLAVVPLGLSKFNTETRMRVHTVDEARSAVAIIDKWRTIFQSVVGHPLVHASDELYLTANGAVPESEAYGDYPMLEDGIGLSRLFIDEFFQGRRGDVAADDDGFFANADRLHNSNPTPYVAMNPAGDTALRATRGAPVALRRKHTVRDVFILTGECAHPVLSEVAKTLRWPWLHVHAVRNDFFGGNTSVSGLMVGSDLQREMQSLVSKYPDAMFLIPDVCLNGGRFLDGTELSVLQSRFRVEVVGSRGHTLRARLGELAEEVTRGE